MAALAYIWPTGEGNTPTSYSKVDIIKFFNVAKLLGEKSNIFICISWFIRVSLSFDHLYFFFGVLPVHHLCQFF